MQKDTLSGFEKWCTENIRYFPTARYGPPGAYARRGNKTDFDGKDRAVALTSNEGLLRVVSEREAGWSPSIYECTTFAHSQSNLSVTYVTREPPKSNARRRRSFDPLRLRLAEPLFGSRPDIAANEKDILSCRDSIANDPAYAHLRWCIDHSPAYGFHSLETASRRTEVQLGGILI